MYNFVMSAPNSPKKTSPKKKTRKPAGSALGKSKALRPSTSDMVVTAITALKDKKGSSLPAIKKYILSTYKVDMTRTAPFIRRYVRTAVKNGELKQVKGSGASGSFRLGTKTAKPSKKARKATEPKKPKKAKKAKKPKKKAKKGAKSPKKKVRITKTKRTPKKSSPKKARKIKKSAVKRTGTVKSKKSAKRLKTK